MTDIVIFGAGDVGEQLFNLLGKERIVCFADNYPKSDTYLGLPLVGFDKLKEMYMANPEMVIIVASYDYFEEICLKLDKSGMGRYYVWPRVGAYRQNYRRELYHYSKLLEDYEVGKYNSIAIYSKVDRIPFLSQLLSFHGFIDKVKYIIRHEDEYKEQSFISSEILYDDFDEIKDDIDLLLMDISRDECKISGIYECKTPFAIADLRCFEKFLHNTGIIQFKNKHKGQRCFIIGNGPSLRMEDLETLHKNKELCFGTNKIYLAFDETSWRPDFYLAEDVLILIQHAQEIHDMNVPNKFIGDRYPPYWDSTLSLGAIKCHVKNEAFGPNMPDFSDDFSAYGAAGTTVTYTTLQLAAYMGFKEIYLLGVDFDYSGDMRKGENHFSKKYVAENDKWNICYLDKALLAYKKAEIYSRLNGFRIFNATRGGKLEVFERVDFDHLMK